MIRLLAALLLLAPQAWAQTKLTMGVTAVAEFTPVFVAMQRGLFSEAGLDVTLQIVPNSSTLIPAMMAGSVQVGGPPAPVFLQAIGQGVPIVCFAAGSQTDPNHPVGGIVAPAGSPIAGRRDLAGKRLAVSGINSIMQILLRQWLMQRGIDATGIGFVEVPFSRMGDALKSGSVDAVVEVEPFVTRMVEDGAKLVIDYYRDVPAGTLSTAYCGTRAWASAHGPAIGALRQVLDRASAYVEEHPAESRQIMAETLKMPAQIAARLPLSTFRSALLPAQITWWVQTLRDQHLLDAPLAPEMVILQ